MAWVTQTKMILAYSNWVRADYVTATAIDNGTADTVFPHTNLGYESPYRVCKIGAGTISSPLRIRVDLGAVRTINCCGIINHTLRTSGQQYIDVQYNNTWGSSGWTDVDSSPENLTTGMPFATYDDDLLFRFTEQTTKRYWAIQITSPANVETIIGSLFFGYYTELASNIVYGGYEHEILNPMKVDYSAGGAKHVVGINPRVEKNLRLTFERVSDATLGNLKRMIQPELGHIVGVVAPDAVDQNFSPTTPHFFGYARSLRSNPQFGPTHNATLELEGV